MKFPSFIFTTNAKFLISRSTLHFRASKVGRKYHEIWYGGQRSCFILFFTWSPQNKTFSAQLRSPEGDMTKEEGMTRVEAEIEI